MNLQRIPVDRLQPAPYNPRLPLKPGSPAYKRLERSLREFDLVQPIVWNERTGHVVAGHQRLEILKHHGHTEVQAVVVSLSLEREKALNVTLNNAQVGSDWDAEKLVDVLAELQALPDFDATLTGFDEKDLRDLVFTPLPEPRTEALDGCDHVRVSLEVPTDDWEDVRPALDDLIATHNITLHIRFPEEGHKSRKT